MVCVAGPPEDADLLKPDGDRPSRLKGHIEHGLSRVLIRRAAAEDDPLAGGAVHQHITRHTVMMPTHGRLRKSPVYRRASQQEEGQHCGHNDDPPFQSKTPFRPWEPGCMDRDGS